MRVWVIAALLACACAAPGTPLEDELDPTTTTDSPITESITFDTNTIKQGIDDDETNAVTNPSIIGKNSNEKGSESNETTPKSTRQKGDDTDETDNTDTSQHKSDYDNSDPDISTTKYDARTNYIPTLKTKSSDEDNQGEVEEDEHVRPYWKNGQNEDNEDEAKRTSKNMKTNISDIDNESEGDEDESTRSFFERRTTKGRKPNFYGKDNQNEGDDDDFHPYWETRTLKNRKINNSAKDNHNEEYEEKGNNLYEEIGTSRTRKTYKSKKDNHSKDDEDEVIHPYEKRRTSVKDIQNEGNGDDDVRSHWGRRITKITKTKNMKTKKSKTKKTKSRNAISKNTKTKDRNKNLENWAIFLDHFGNNSSDINTKRESRKHTIHVKRTKYPNLGEMRDIFPSSNHKYYNHFDDSREDDRRNNYEPRIDSHHNKGIWNGIWKSSVDKYRRRERYPDSYDSYRGRSEYRGGRTHYGYKDSEEKFYNSPDRQRYDDYHRHRNDNYKRRTYSHHGYRDQKRYRDNNWHEGRRYYNKERNSGRKDYRDYHRNDKYNRDDGHYGNFARHNGWRHSKSYSRYEDF